MDNNVPVNLPATTGFSGAQSKARQLVRRDAGIEDTYSEMWRRLWTMKWTLLNVTFAGMVLALMIGAVETPLYRVRTSLEVQEMNGKSANLNPADVPPETNDRSLSEVQTQIRILMSRSLVERTIAKMPETARSRLLDVPRPFWRKPSFDGSVESIVKRVNARPSTHARIIDVNFLCQDSTTGAAFLNALAQELADYSLERRWKTSQRTQALLERELDDFRQKLEQSEREAEEYARVSGFALTPEKSTADEAKLLTLQDELSDVQVDAKTQSTVAPEPVKLDAREIARDPQLKALSARLALLKKQEADLEAIYTPQHQSVVKLKEDVAAVQMAYNKRRSAVTALLRQRALQARKQVLEEDYRHQSQVVGDDAGRLAHYKTLEREVDANQKLFDTMTARMKEASVTSALQASNILVVDPAYPSAAVALPNQWINGALGGATGFVIGLIYVFVRHRITQRFAGPATLNRYLRLPFLGTIPADVLNTRVGALPEALPSGPILDLAFDKGLQTAESYRAVRSSILNALGHRTGPWRLLFVSAGTNEGKTSVVGNLGAALAGARRKVLIIDADLRNPTLHKIFGMENEIGLVEFLSRQLPPAADARQLIRATQIDGLYLLSAGRPGVNAPEILASDHFSLLLRDLVQGFDLVLVDSPPILPYADARSLAREVDTTVLVVRANSTEIEAAIRARDTMAQDGIDILGTILTDWNADAHTLRFQAGYSAVT